MDKDLQLGIGGCRISRISSRPSSRARLRRLTPWEVQKATLARLVTLAWWRGGWQVRNHPASDEQNTWVRDNQRIHAAFLQATQISIQARQIPVMGKDVDRDIDLDISGMGMVHRFRIPCISKLAARERRLYSLPPR